MLFDAHPHWFDRDFLDALGKGIGAFKKGLEGKDVDDDSDPKLR